MEEILKLEVIMEHLAGFSILRTQRDIKQFSSGDLCGSILIFSADTLVSDN
jgi:hypothetical protein